MRRLPIFLFCLFAIVSIPLAAETMMQCILRCPAGNNPCSRCCTDQARAAGVFSCNRACDMEPFDCPEMDKCGKQTCSNPGYCECSQQANKTCGERWLAKMKACRKKCDAIQISGCGGPSALKKKKEPPAAAEAGSRP